MSLPRILGVGAGLVGAASGTYLGVRAGSALERRLSPDERDAVKGVLTTVIPTSRVIDPASSQPVRLGASPGEPVSGEMGKE